MTCYMMLQRSTYFDQWGDKLSLSTKINQIASNLNTDRKEKSSQKGNYIIQIEDIIVPKVQQMEENLTSLVEKTRKYFSPKKEEKIGDPCFLPPGFPTSTILEPKDLKFCGKNQLVDDQCEETDCSCTMSLVKRNHGTYGYINSFLKMYLNAHRRKERIKIISSALQYPNKLQEPFVLMYINSGFLFLFQNWLCSCEKSGIKFKKILLVLAGDTGCEKFLKNQGINYVSAVEWYLKGTSIRIQKKAAAKFGWEPHGNINILGIAILNDVVQLGKTVLLMDTDIVWRRNPLPYLMAAAVKSDIQMMHDPNRIESKGPGNTGFVFVRSNCRTRIFLDTFVHHLWLSRYFGGSDQSCWNSLLKSPPFRLIRYTTLSEKLFINGHQFHLGQYMVPGILNSNYFAVHVSWTKSWDEKLPKLKKIKHWYLDDKTCIYSKNATLPEKK